MGEVCKKCGSTGWDDSGFCSCEVGKRYAAERFRERQIEAGIPPRHRGVRFDNLHEQLNQPAEAARGFANAYQEHKKTGTGLLLSGPVGRGKTWLACAVLNELIAAGITVRFINVNDFFTDYHASLKMERRYADPLFKAQGVELLLMDDLGKENLSEAKLKTLYALLNHRYDNLRPTIITANLPLKDVYVALYRLLGEDTTAEAITSRLTQCNKVLYCRGKDLRTIRKG